LTDATAVVVAEPLSRPVNLGSPVRQTFAGRFPGQDPAAMPRASNATLIRVILPFSTCIQFATGTVPATLVARSNQVSRNRFVSAGSDCYGRLRR
jgi:hypothetical protein